MTVLRHRFAPFVGLALFFGIWELYVRLAKVGEYKLIKPSRAFSEIVRNPGFYWNEAKPTIGVAIAGFFLAFVVAFAIGSTLAHSVTAERAVFPVVILVVVTPLFAYITALIVWIGFGYRTLIVAVAIVCFPPMLFNTVAGLRAIDPNARELLDSVHASRWEIYRKLRVPSALPYLLSAAKLSAGLSLVGVTIGEPYAFVPNGLGNTIRRAASSGNVNIPQLWGSIYVLGFLGAIAYLAISGIETIVRRRHGLTRNT
jgi:NitT/TauT family transport system permease protein